MPEVSADFTVWTVRLQPGICFADDPAFKGKPRELVAADYVYAFKRISTRPTRARPTAALDDEGILGLERAARSARCATRSRSTTTASLEGLRALDRYTLQFKLAEPRPRFVDDARRERSYGAVAREVVEAYGDDIDGAPGRHRARFGSSQWRRSSLIVLETQPGLPRGALRRRAGAGRRRGPGAAGQRFKGRRLPLIDGVEIVDHRGEPAALAELPQRPGRLAARVPPEFVAERGARTASSRPTWPSTASALQRYRQPRRHACRTSTWRTRWSAATRRRRWRCAARSAWPTTSTTRSAIIRRGQAIPAQAPMAPRHLRLRPGAATARTATTTRRAPRRCSTSTATSTATATAGASSPTARRCVSTMSTAAASRSTASSTRTGRRALAAIGVRMVFETAQWPEHMKAGARRQAADVVPRQHRGRPRRRRRLLEYMYGPSIGQPATSRASSCRRSTTIYERMLDLPDGPERAALFRKASELVVAYMPYRIHVHRIYNDLLASLDRRLPAAVLSQPVLALRRGRRRDARRRRCA